MQVELSIKELKIIADWGNSFYDPDDQDVKLLGMVQSLIKEAEELESIDLNACDGGGCTL